MSEKCSWLHNQLESLPPVRFPFDIKSLPSNGIYFFYEEGETTEHGSSRKPRIVRIEPIKKTIFKLEYLNIFY